MSPALWAEHRNEPAPSQTGLAEALESERTELAARRLRSIEHALEREARGELITCERCKGQISEARMRALPGATLCISCAREAETAR